jgi:nucleotide-binding universal stress UspA family protein
MQRKKTTKKASKKRTGKTAKKTRKKRVDKTTRRPAGTASKKTGKKTARRRPSGTSNTAAQPSSPAVSEYRRQAPSTATSRETGNPGSSKKDKCPILVPVDFSAHSEAALEYAADLAERLNAPMAVLHVVHDPGEAPGYYRVKGRKKQLRRLEDVAKELFDEFMDKMIKRNSKCAALRNAQRLLVTGLPVTRILEVAKRLEPRMLIMGSAGRTAISRFVLGSKSEQLLRICPYPVMIVKAPNNEE